MGKTTSSSEEDDARVRLIAPGFWVDDLAQVSSLSQQSGRYQVPYLRRQALYLGTKTLSASLGPHRQTRRRGLYKDMELAGELQPLLASPVQFCERHGYSVVSSPASLTALVKALSGKELMREDVLHPEAFLALFLNREATIPTGKGDEAKGQYWIEDLEQLEALAEQHSRDHIAFLRKVAFRIGVLLLTASGPVSGPFGLYETAESVAVVLCPLLAPAILFLEDQGYSVFPVPAVVNTLLDLIGRLVDGATHLQTANRRQDRSVRSETGVERREQDPVRGSTPIAKGRATISKEKRERMNLENDGSL